MEVKNKDWTKWITALVGVSTALFSVTSFAYKEMITPNAVPINISLDLKVEQRAGKPIPISHLPGAGGRNDKKGSFIPILFTVKAINDSNKTLELQKPFWIVYGIHKTTEPYTSNMFLAPRKFVESFNKSIGNPLQSDITRIEVPPHSYFYEPQKAGFYTLPKNQAEDKLKDDDQRLITGTPRKLISVGEVFSQRELRSKEQIQAQRTIFIDTSDNYDFLEARVYIPTLAKGNSSQQGKTLFYSFISDQTNNPKTLLQRSYLQNSWCEKPMKSQLVESKDLLGLLTLLEPRIFHEIRQVGKSSSEPNAALRQTSFCRSDPKIQRSPLLLNSNLSQKMEKELGAQIFITSYEVLLDPKPTR